MAKGKPGQVIPYTSVEPWGTVLNGLDRVAVQLDSQHWFMLLLGDDVSGQRLSSFRHTGPAGRSFTARRDTRNGRPYWYAYAREGRELRKLYMGKPERLTLARLNEIADRLAVPGDALRKPVKAVTDPELPLSGGAE